MERIFWRHGQASWAKQDLLRSLTQFGQQQAQASADWLREQREELPIYSSEAVRAQETASYYATPKQLPGLNPDGLFADAYEALTTIEDSSAIVVGHLPWIGQVVGQMLDLPNAYVAMETSEIFWLSSQDGLTWSLFAHYSTLLLKEKKPMQDNEHR